MNADPHPAHVVQRPPAAHGLRGRLIASHAIVIVIALLLVLTISTAYLRRFETAVQRDRLEEIAKTLTISVNFIARDRLLTNATSRIEAVDSLADQEEIRLLVLNRTGTVLYDSDQTARLTGTTLTEFSDVTTELIQQTDSRLTIQQRWLDPSQGSPFAGQYALLSSGGPGRQGRALLVVAPDRRFPLLALYIPRVLIIAAISLAIATLVGYLLSVRLAAPIVRLTRAADAMAAGNLEQEVPDGGDDELGRLVRSFNTMSRQVARTARSQRELLANVAHELRTPLTSIQGYAQAVRDHVVQTEEERTQALTTIGEEAHRMGSLIEQLLDLARLESGQTTMVLAPVQVDQLFDRTLSRFRNAATDRHVTLRAAPAPTLVIEGDEGRLLQLLSNLIENALRHTSAGGHIRLWAEAAIRHPHEMTGRVRITVADTGAGIDPAILPRLFERFSSSGTVSNSRDGVGLGLAIVREIVGLHAGTISVSSGVGVGTTFVIELPAGKTDR